MYQLTPYDKDPGKRDRLIAINDTKKCSKCGEHVLIADYYWLKTQNTPMSCCKTCWKSSRQTRWHTDPTMREAQKDWIEKNRQHIRDRENARYANDAEFRAKKKAWAKASWLKKKGVDKE